MPSKRNWQLAQILRQLNRQHAQILRQFSRTFIIDSYVDAETFEMLDVRAEGVEAVIYTGGVGKGLTKVRDLHNAQSGRESIEIYRWRVESHDRWLVIDDILYHLGPSAKDAGRKIGGINRMGTSPEVILNEMK